MYSFAIKTTPNIILNPNISYVVFGWALYANYFIYAAGNLNFGIDLRIYEPWNINHFICLSWWIYLELNYIFIRGQ